MRLAPTIVNLMAVIRHRGVVTAVRISSAAVLRSTDRVAVISVRVALIKIDWCIVRPSVRRPNWSNPIYEYTP